jgi:adenylate cyclase
MGVEIEYKFLVENDDWKVAADSGVDCLQGYLLVSPEKTIRVRVMGENAFLTIKGKTTGITRAEFEYSIPVRDAQELLQLCGNRLVKKRRYFVLHQGNRWEVDVFEGRHQGLVLAEIELESEDQSFDCPHWLGTEVSADPRYTNAVLAKF